MAKVKLQVVDGAPPVEVELDRMATDAGEVYEVCAGEYVGEVEALWDDSDSGRLRLHGRVVPFHVWRDGDRMHLWMEGKTHSLAVVDGVARRAGGTGAHATAAEQLVAPMPGTILKIQVAPGDAFAAHQPLIIMESMKMEMTLSSPQGGRVREVTCKVGELVELGRLLAKLSLGESDDRAS